MRDFLLVAVSAALLSACGETAAPVAEAPKPAFGSFGVDLAQMDATVRPGDDFYSYVNGKWLTTFQMPADRAGYTTGTRRVREDGGRHPQPSSTSSRPARRRRARVAQKVGDLYAGWMDEAGIESRGIEPLQPYLGADRGGQGRRRTSMKLVGDIDYTGAVRIYIYPDTADPTKYTVWDAAVGLGMPNRDYYLNKGDEVRHLSRGLREYVTKIFELDRRQGSRRRPPDTVIALENKIADGALGAGTPAQRQATNNPDGSRRPRRRSCRPSTGMSCSPVVGLGDEQRFIVNETTAHARWREAARHASRSTHGRSISTFHLVESTTRRICPKRSMRPASTSSRRRCAAWRQQRDRWKRGVSAARRADRRRSRRTLRRKYFPPENKAKMDALVANLRTALGRAA